MKILLEKAALSFVRAFGASALVLSLGVLSAPNLNQAYGLGVAALIASIAAGVKAIQVLVPGISFASFISQPLAAWVDSFSRAFIGTFLVAMIGILNAPDLSTSRSLLTAAIVGAVAAGLRAIQGLATTGEEPAKEVGV